MIVFWRVLNVDWFFVWYVNWVAIQMFAESTVLDDVLKPTPVYQFLTRRRT